MRCRICSRELKKITLDNPLIKKGLCDECKEAVKFKPVLNAKIQGDPCHLNCKHMTVPIEETPSKEELKKLLQAIKYFTLYGGKL